MLTDLYFFFFAASGGSPTPTPTFTAGAATFVGATYSAVNLQATAATGGTGSVAVQWQRSARGIGSWSNVAGLTSLTASDTTAAAATLYDYRLAYTDAAPTTVYSNVVGASLAFNGTGGTGAATFVMVGTR